MSKLLEILGKAITVDTTSLIWHWLDTVNLQDKISSPAQRQQLKQVINLMAEAKFEDARQQLGFYLFETPSCLLGRLASAGLFIREAKISEAIEELNVVYRYQPNNTMALYALGHCYERLGKEEKAIEFYQDCIKFKNYLQLPRQRLAAIYFKNGQLHKTINEYELLKQQYPDDISAIVILGHLYIADGNYGRAIDTFDNAILMHPDNFLNPDDDLGLLTENQDLYEELEKLDDLLTQLPDRADVLLRKADLLIKLGQTTDAISHYQQALRICPDFLEANIKLGIQYLQLNQKGFAAQQFNTAAWINDEIVAAYLGLVTAQSLLGKKPHALATLSLAAAIQPNTTVLLAQTAVLQFEMYLAHNGRHTPTMQEMSISSVIDAHRRQITAQPENPDLHYRFGLLMMSVANLSAAIEAFKTVLNINTTHTPARNKLVICLFETRRENNALDQLTTTNCPEKATLELHYKVALLYCDKLKFASSLMNLHSSLHLNFTRSYPTVNISIVLQNLGLLDRTAIMWDNLSDTVQHAADTPKPRRKAQ